MGTINTTSGATIRKSLIDNSAETSNRLRTIIASDYLPREHRIAQRVSAIDAASVALGDATVAYHAWRSQAIGEAQRVLAARPATTTADELKIARLIETARLSGTPKHEARELAGRAADAYTNAMGPEGYREARLLALAAIEVGAKETAVSVLEAAERQLETDEQREARRVLDAIPFEDLAFNRDTAAFKASVLTEAASAAKAMNDTANLDRMQSEAAKASSAAKMIEFRLSQEQGRTYIEPEGAITGVTTGVRHVSDSELSKRVVNVTTGGVS